VRRREGPDKKYFWASATVHVVALVLAWWTQVARPRPLELVSYQIEIVSPPAAQEAEEPAPQPEEELVVETPEPTPPPEDAEPDPVVEEPEDVEEKPEPTATPPPPEPEEEAGEPEPEAEAGGEDINVRMEGLRKDYPAYYDNIIRQIHRCLRFRGPGGLETSVYFHITPEGEVGNLRFVDRSGNAEFDFAVMGAVECAGNGRLGPLPEDLRMDRFPVIFEVTSSRRRGPE
jgi:outer membrane biosynthesis protein TonB